MKKSEFWILLVSFAILFIGCEKENGSINGNPGGGIVTQDDAGIELNLSNSGSSGIGFEYNYYSGLALRIHITLESSHFSLKIDGDNNFYFESGNDYAERSISKFGNVTSISAITSMPSSGWVNTIAVNPGSGYVVRYRGNGFNYTYVRIYVKCLITNTLGEIIGATVVYQDNWGKEQGSPNLAGCEYVSYNQNYNLTFNDASTGTINGDNFSYTKEERHGIMTFGGQSHQFYFGDNYLWLEIDGTTREFQKTH